MNSLVKFSKKMNHLCFECFICLFTFKLKTKWKKSKIPII